MQKFLNKSSPPVPQSKFRKTESIYNSYVIHHVMVYGQKKYLIVSFKYRMQDWWLTFLIIQIKEIDVLNMDIPLESPELFCDVCCLMYDHSDSKSFECIGQTYIVSLKFPWTELLFWNFVEKL